MINIGDRIVLKKPLMSLNEDYIGSEFEVLEVREDYIEFSSHFGRGCIGKKEVAKHFDVINKDKEGNLEELDFMNYHRKNNK